jgi:hypothetical protein
MKSPLSSRPVLWFLFLFNAAVAVAAAVAGPHIHIHGHAVAGGQQIMTVAGMGVVAAGAGRLAYWDDSGDIGPQTSIFTPVLS